MNLRLLALVYAVPAAAGTALCFVPPFTGVGVLRALAVSLLAAAALRDAATRSRYGPLIALGAACGAFGDFALATAERAWFIPGLVAFLVGHIFYIVAFARNRAVTGPRKVVASASVLAVLTLAVLVAVRVVNAGQTQLLGPILVYVAVIAAMAVAAVLHKSRAPWIACGAVIFLVSDSHIAVNHILLASPNIWLAVSGYITYYLAQGFIVLGAMQEGREEGG